MTGASHSTASSPFELESLGLASYRWGSFLPRFLPVGDVEAGDLKKHLVALKAGRAEWRHAGEFRSWVALTHELVHYLQDVTTGVGHWDYVLHEKTVGKAFGMARGMASVDASPPFGWTAFGEGALVVKGDAVPAARLEALRRNGGPVDAAGAPERFMLIQHVLEVEAVAVTMRQVFFVATEQPTWNLAWDERSTWMPGHIGDEYDELYAVVHQVFEHTFGSDRLASTQKLMLSGQLVCLLADLACAHPSPQLVAERGIDVTQYEPGLKLMRMLSAVTCLEGDDMDRFVTAFLNDDVETAEVLVLSKVSVPYLRSREVYEDWKARLERMEIRDEPLMREFRIRACEARLEDPNVWLEKNAYALFMGGLSVWVLSADGPSSLAQNLDIERQPEALAEFLRRGVELQLIDHFFATGRYRCPWAYTVFCDGAVPACRTGWRHLTDLPTAECGVRDFLAHHEFEGFI